MEQDLEAVSYPALADMQISLWVSNHFSNPDFSWLSVACRDSVLLTWINKLVEASWSEATDSPLPRTAQTWHICIKEALVLAHPEF